MSVETAGDCSPHRGEPASQAAAPGPGAPSHGRLLRLGHPVYETARQSPRDSPKVAKRKGAQPGHPGAGRRTFEAGEAERVVDVAAEVDDRCPVCHYPLEEKGTDGRLVVERRPVKAERVLYRLPKPYGPRCRRTFRPRPPAVLPKSLYGHQLVATASTMHYLHGIPLGRVCEQTGLGPGSLVEIFGRMARRHHYGKSSSGCVPGRRHTSIICLSAASRA